MNWIVTLACNGKEMTRRAVESFLSQDLPVKLLAINNDARDGTADYLRSVQGSRVFLMNFAPARGVSKSWNAALDWLFANETAPAVLVCNNDVILRPDAYRRLLDDGGPFVTAVGSDNPGCAKVLSEPALANRRPHPDFSCFLIRRAVWQTIGRFDDSMVNYCSDGDYHLRMHKAGIEAVSIDLPFYHVASGTLKSMDDEARDILLKQADNDRHAFESKWGFKMGSDAYYRAFGHDRPDDPGAAQA